MSTSSCAATARTKSCSGYCEDRDANENMEGMKYEPHRAASPVATPHGNVSVTWYSLVKIPICRYYLGQEKCEMILHMTCTSTPVRVLLIRRRSSI